jgi:hypothetical protein
MRRIVSYVNSSIVYLKERGGIDSLIIWQVIEKWWQNMFNILVCMCCLKKGLVIIVALIPDHAPNLMSWNDTSCIGIEFSAGPVPVIVKSSCIHKGDSKLHC